MTLANEGESGSVVTLGVTHDMSAVKKTQPDEQDTSLIRRSYYTTKETHSIMETGAADAGIPIYAYLAAAVEAFEPKKNPEHQKIVERMLREKQIAELTKQLKHLDPAAQKAVIKSLIK